MAFTSPNTLNQTKILIVEDNKIDARLTSQALEKTKGWQTTINVVDDGDKAVKFLCRDESFSNAERPDLVILDLNLPKYDGSEVLQFIRTNESLRNLLVFIFSSSPTDVAAERMLRARVSADKYFEKPHQVSTYLSIAAEMKESYQLAKLDRKGTSA